jgi:YfiH family protein
MITLNALAAGKSVRHAFFTRQGGVSNGLFSSLNCGFGSGDDREKVAHNRTTAAAHIGVAPERLITCYQIHGTEVITVTRPWEYADAPRADAMVTRTPDIALGVLAADCAPVLFCDPEAKVVGAAHGGWRGTLTGVMEATVAAMVDLGASPATIHAGIGPCIAQPSYEVGPEFRDRFAAEDSTSLTFFEPAPRTGHFLFDLPGYIGARLGRLGLAAVQCSGHDTAADEDLFFSYRRACHRGEKDYGRGLAAIALVD